MPESRWMHRKAEEEAGPDLLHAMQTTGTTAMRSGSTRSAAACGRGGPADRVKDRERVEVVAPVSDLAVDDG
jgi:hypothetical protein